MPALSASSLATSGCLAVDTAGRVLPLRRTHLAAEAGAGHARVTLEQTFHNPHPEPLDVTYTLPLPADGAVAGFRFVVGEHEVVGEVQPKAQARETFETALVEGRTAALLDEERSSVFRQQLGNIPPGATLTCSITIDQPLAWDEGQWTWRFPTVVGPRYLGSMPAADAAGVVVEVATDGVPDAGLSAALTIADLCTGTPSSPSHAVEIEGGHVALGGALDRDVVVRWPVSQPVPGVAVQVARHGGEAHAAITVVPPRQPGSVLPRHLVVLLDTSGSMGGRPLDQAKELTGALIATLGPADHLELLAFASSVERFHEGPMAMDLAGRRKALAWLRARRAGGGTEMTTGIQAAVSGASVGGAQKQVILVTDGYIGFEADIVGIALDERDQDTRVHTVGVGSSVNRSLTEPVARAGGGQEVVLGIDEPVGPAAARLVAHTAQPVVVDLELTGAAVHTTSHRLPDLYAGAPVTLFAAVDPAGGAVVLRGRTAEGVWEHALTLPVASEEGPASVRWARDQVADLELLCAAGRRPEARERRIEAIGVGFQISTRFTSWVATTTHRTVDPDAESRQVTQPQALPHGVSAEGVGLRSAASGGLVPFGGGMASGALDVVADEESDSPFLSSRSRAMQAPAGAKTAKRRSRAPSGAPPAPQKASAPPPPPPPAKPMAGPTPPEDSPASPFAPLEVREGHRGEGQVPFSAPRREAPRRFGWALLLFLVLGILLGAALLALVLWLVGGV
jgi:Ca-activated chloride channel family protein